MSSLWLTLHILGAIIAFGIGFTAPIFGSMLAKEPQHSNWYLRANKRVYDILAIPAALSMAVTGVLLVMSKGGTARFGELWLAVAIVIYAGAILTVFLVQRPTMTKLIALTSAPPGPEGPPPEVPLLVARMRAVGMGLGVAVIVIVFLMVFKPTL